MASGAEAKKAARQDECVSSDLDNRFGTRSVSRRLLLEQYSCLLLPLFRVGYLHRPTLCTASDRVVYLRLLLNQRGGQNPTPMCASVTTNMARRSSSRSFFVLIVLVAIAVIILRRTARISRTPTRKYLSAPFAMIPANKLRCAERSHSTAHGA